jgi:hypothetical protein
MLVKRKSIDDLAFTYDQYYRPKMAIQDTLPLTSLSDGDVISYIVMFENCTANFVDWH